MCTTDITVWTYSTHLFGDAIGKLTGQGCSDKDRKHSIIQYLRWLFGLTVLAVVIGTPQSAFGQCAASAAPAFPGVVTVGDTGVSVQLQLTNQSATVALGGCGSIEVPFVDLVPSCVTGIGICAVVDPGVFAVSPLTGTGCGTTWTVTALGDPAGSYRFTPLAAPTIAPAGGTCNIDFQVNVLKLPVDSSAGVLGLQTQQLGIGQFPSTQVAQTATATGQDETTVWECPPTSTCRAAVGACDVAEICTPAGLCPADGFAAATTTCRASAGACDVAESCPGTGPACPADGFAAATTTCRPSTGTCDPAESCPGNAVSCPADVSLDPSIPGCVTAACRTAGYWGTHAGNENGSVNITQLAIAAGGPLNICGETISNTDLNSINSAVEAICASGGGQTQLIRQLTALSLNCIASGEPFGPANCVGISPFEAAFTACNQVCQTGTVAQINSCINVVDCLNNGGTPALTPTGAFFCATGKCSDNDANCTIAHKPLCANPGTATCVPVTSTCHDEPLPWPDSPASSSNKCNQARGNTCEITDASCP